MAHPLLCWDIAMEGMCRRQEFASDIAALKKLIDKTKYFSGVRALDNCIVWENKTIIVTDTRLRILLATKNMYEMNGYRPGEVIGKSPKIFQGEATTPESGRKIRIAIENSAPFMADIVNYRKDGSIYNCRIEGYPVFDQQGKPVNFIALENLVL